MLAAADHPRQRRHELGPHLLLVGGVGAHHAVAHVVVDERYCIDVLQQISAAQAALDKVAIALVDDHVRHCVMGADASNQEEMRAELMTALTRMVGRR